MEILGIQQHHDHFITPEFRMAERQDPLYMWPQDGPMDNGQSSSTHSPEVTSPHHSSNSLSRSTSLPAPHSPIFSRPPGMNPVRSGDSLQPPQAHVHPGNEAYLSYLKGASGSIGSITPNMPVSSASAPTSPLVVPQPLKVNKPPKTYHCRMCDQEFIGKSDMHRHAKEVHGLEEKAHKCDKCYKSFPSSQQLTQHLLVHNNIRKYSCQFCDKMFKQLSHVQQHQRRHTGERPYRCNIEGCEKAFAQLSNLQQHQRNHEGSRLGAERKPFPCTICDRRFATEVSLDNHVTKLHLPVTLAPPQDKICRMCEKQFTSNVRYLKHLYKAHPDYWKIISGGKPLEFFIPPEDMNPSSTTPHIPRRREKRFSCQICNKQYSHETGYLKHMASHPESEQNLSVNLLSCVVCQKYFTKEAYLLRHMEMKLDPEHEKAMIEFKKQLGIKNVGRIDLPPGSTTKTLIAAGTGTWSSHNNGGLGRLPLGMGLDSSKLQNHSGGLFGKEENRSRKPSSTATLSSLSEDNNRKELELDLSRVGRQKSLPTPTTESEIDLSQFKDPSPNLGPKTMSQNNLNSNGHRPLSSESRTSSVSSLTDSSNYLAQSMSPRSGGVGAHQRDHRSLSSPIMRMNSHDQSRGGDSNSLSNTGIGMNVRDSGLASPSYGHEQHQNSVKNNGFTSPHSPRFPMSPGPTRSNLSSPRGPMSPTPTSQNPPPMDTDPVRNTMTDGKPEVTIHHGPPPPPTNQYPSRPHSSHGPLSPGPMSPPPRLEQRLDPRQLPGPLSPFPHPLDRSQGAGFYNPRPHDYPSLLSHQTPFSALRHTLAQQDFLAQNLHLQRQGLQQRSQGSSHGQDSDEFIKALQSFADSIQ